MAIRQRSFTALAKYKSVIDNWIIHRCTGLKAYQKVYPNSSDNTAKVEFCKILKLPKVKEYANQVTTEIHDKNIITVNELITHLSSIATADISEAFDVDGNPRSIQDMPKSLRMAIKHFEVIETTMGKTTTRKVKISLNREWSVSMLFKYFLNRF